MGSLVTDLPIVQFKRLSEAVKAQIAEDLFMMIEYDEDERPDADRSPGDIAQGVYDILERHGVRPSDANHMPNGYRFNQHQRAGGKLRCGFSLVSVVEPMARKTKGNIHCPYGCPDSIVEVDPDATSDLDTLVNVDAVKVYLKDRGIPFDTFDYTLYVGHGSWDEEAERYTHPITFGPCAIVQGRLTADPYDAASYGLRTPGAESFCIDDDDDAERVADGIARLYWEQVPPVLAPTG